MPVGDPVIRTMLSHPPYQRAFWRALADADYVVLMIQVAGCADLLGDLHELGQRFSYGFSSAEGNNHA